MISSHQQKRTKRFKNLGFSLLEVMIATGLLSILGLGVMSMTTDMLKNSKHIQNIGDAANLVQTLNKLLEDPAACKRNFGTAPGPGSVLFDGSVRTTDLVNNSGSTVFDVASTVTYENRQFYITDYNFESAVTVLNPASPARVHGKLSFTLTKVSPASSSGLSSLKRSVTIDANLVGAVGTGIDTCHALGSLAIPSTTWWSLAADTISIINSNPGNVGIGLAAPLTKLHVEGHVAAVNTGVTGFAQLWSDNSLIWKRGNANGGLRFAAADDLSATGYFQQMIILDNGNVGMGVSTPAEKLEVNGKITAYDDIQVAPTKGFVYLSDQRLKTNKKVINGLKIIQKIQGYNFEWIKDGQYDAGFMAQEVRAAFPEAVKVGFDGYLRVDYPKVIVPLLQAVKQQQVQIEKMQMQITELRKK